METSLPEMVIFGGPHLICELLDCFKICCIFNAHAFVEVHVGSWPSITNEGSLRSVLDFNLQREVKQILQLREYGISNL